MQVSLKQLPATEVAYLRHIGPYGAAVGAFWKSNFIPWLHANGLAGRAQYGIGHDDPSVTAADIGAAWTELLRIWLPASGMQIDARPCFEHYPVDARYDATTGAFSCELCLPVAPL